MTTPMGRSNLRNTDSSVKQGHIILQKDILLFKKDIMLLKKDIMLFKKDMMLLKKNATGEGEEDQWIEF